MELYPCSRLGECGPQVRCLCPLPGLCRQVLGWPSVALASKSCLGLPACGELCESPAVVGLRGCGLGGVCAAPQKNLLQVPPPSTAGGRPSSHALLGYGVAGNRKDLRTHRVYPEVPQTDLSVAPTSFGDGLCAGRVALFLKHQGAFVRVSHV